jgi:hypothetical protein
MINGRYGAMKIGDVVKNAPNALIYTVGMCFVAVVAAFTILSSTGGNTSDLRAFLVPIVSVLSAMFSAGALITSGAAAKSSANAEKQTNGIADAERHDIATRAAKEAIRSLATDPDTK